MWVSHLGIGAKTTRSTDTDGGHILSKILQNFDCGIKSTLIDKSVGVGL